MNFRCFFCGNWSSKDSEGPFFHFLEWKSWRAKSCVQDSVHISKNEFFTFSSTASPGCHSHRLDFVSAFSSPQLSMLFLGPMGCGRSFSRVSRVSVRSNAARFTQLALCSVSFATHRGPSGRAGRGPGGAKRTGSLGRRTGNLRVMVG